VGKYNISLLFLPFVPLHNLWYKTRPGIALLLPPLRGLLPAWYFAEDLAPVWEFTKLIYPARFVNFES
jgi:hypothetical protein